MKSEQSGQAMHRVEENQNAAGIRFFPTLFSNFYELLKLNLQFLAGCLAVITIPAAITALYSQVFLMLDPQLLYPDTGFWQCLKAKMKSALVLGAAVGGALVFAGFSCWLYAAIFAQSSPLFYVLAGIALCLFLLVFCVGIAAFALLSVTEEPVRCILYDAVSLACHYPGHVLGGAITDLFLLTASVLLFPGSILFVVFIAFSFMIFISAYLIRTEMESRFLKKGGKQE